MYKSKSRSSLYKLVLGILLGSFGCGGSESDLTSASLMEPEDFIETYVALRTAHLASEDGEVTQEVRSRVLDRQGILEEDLIAFVETYGENLTLMREIWDEIELRLENKVLSQEDLTH